MTHAMVLTAVTDKVLNTHRELEVTSNKTGKMEREWNNGFLVHLVATITFTPYSLIIQNDIK